MSDALGAAPLHVVVGASGQIGAHVVKQLVETGARVRAVTRSPLNLAAVESATGDIGDEAQAARLCAGASVVYACFGGPQTTWATEFPRMTRGLLAGAAQARARVVFADNLYAYGPQHGVLTEDTPLNAATGKPKLRSEIAALFLDEHRAGRVPVAIARAADLYGPGVTNAMLSQALVTRVLAGKTVFLAGDPRAPHTFTFAPDVARTLIRLANSSAAWGEVWHVPSAPAVPLIELMAVLGQLSGKPARTLRVPTTLLRAGALFSPVLRELTEMSFQWDRPYLVSHTKLTTEFGVEPTSLERGLRLTLDWVQKQQHKP
jgi:nucleoside-diphosphate-sugar epimerase